jgi:hypothetical protein
MKIPESSVASLQAFDYTEAEARFLYIVATHSGYFTMWQFLDFVEGASGKRSAHFAEKLFALGHASAQRYRRRSLVYHLDSRHVYTAISKQRLRHRREHELDHIKTQLLALDFILAHPDHDYFETRQDKHRYLIEELKLDAGLVAAEANEINPLNFSDGFPLCLASPSPGLPPVVTFTYIDSGQKDLAAYIAHLRAYLPLFRRLQSFQFLYISTAAGALPEAGLIFSLLVEGKGLDDLVRYFVLQTKWDSEQYTRLTEADILYLQEARRRYAGDFFATLYRLWRRNEFPRELRRTGTESEQRIHFRVVTVPGHDTVFGNTTKRWGEAWQIRSRSRAATLRASPKGHMQPAERRADT